LKRLSDYFGKMRATEITTARISLDQASQKEDGYSNATINRDMAALKRVLRLELRAGKVDRVPGIDMLYDSGLRLLECVRLRIKDVDLARHELLIRDGKGQKDRVTMLPHRLTVPLTTHLAVVKAQHDRDLAAGRGSVALPGALRAKYPRAPWEWAWQWVFPATRFHRDRDTGERRRHHHDVVRRICRFRAGPAGGSVDNYLPLLRLGHQDSQESGSRTRLATDVVVERVELSTTCWAD
jgi:integrase